MRRVRLNAPERCGPGDFEIDILVEIDGELAGLAVLVDRTDFQRPPAPPAAKVCGSLKVSPAEFIRPTR